MQNSRRTVFWMSLLPFHGQLDAKHPKSLVLNSHCLSCGWNIWICFKLVLDESRSTESGQTFIHSIKFQPTLNRLMESLELSVLFWAWKNTFLHNSSYPKGAFSTVFSNSASEFHNLFSIQYNLVILKKKHYWFKRRTYSFFIQLPENWEQRMVSYQICLSHRL